MLHLSASIASTTHFDASRRIRPDSSQQVHRHTEKDLDSSSPRTDHSWRCRRWGIGAFAKGLHGPQLQPSLRQQTASCGHRDTIDMGQHFHSPWTTCRQAWAVKASTNVTTSILFDMSDKSLMPSSGAVSLLIDGANGGLSRGTRNYQKTPTSRMFVARG